MSNDRNPQGGHRLRAGRQAQVVSDELVEPASPDYGDKWSIRAADEPPRFPGDGPPPPFRGPLLPAPGGLPAVLIGVVIGARHDGVPLRTT